MGFGRGNPKFKGFWTYKDTKFETLTAMSKSLSISMPTLSLWCARNNEKRITIQGINTTPFLQILYKKYNIIGKSFKDIGFGLEEAKHEVQEI